MIQRAAAWVSAGWLLGAAAATASGDVLPLEAGGCDKHQAGDVCKTPAGSPGRCAYRRFTRTLPPLPDHPPATQTYERLVCEAQPAGKGRPWVWIVTLGLVSMAAAVGAAATLGVLLVLARRRRGRG